MLFPQSLVKSIHISLTSPPQEVISYRFKLPPPIPSSSLPPGGPSAFNKFLLSILPSSTVLQNLSLKIAPFFFNIPLCDIAVEIEPDPIVYSFEDLSIAGIVYDTNHDTNRGSCIVPESPA